MPTEPDAAAHVCGAPRRTGRAASRCRPGTGNSKPAGAKFAALAIADLRAAVARGYRNIPEMANDDLDALRRRADFLAVLTELGRTDTDPAGLRAALLGLGRKLLDTDRAPAAEVVLRAALAANAKEAPDPAADLAFGDALLAQKKYAEAEPLILKVYEGRKHLENTVPPQGFEPPPRPLTA